MMVPSRRIERDRYFAPDRLEKVIARYRTERGRK
jgi:hypothetical protein